MVEYSPHTMEGLLCPTSLGGFLTFYLHVLYFINYLVSEGTNMNLVTASEFNMLLQMSEWWQSSQRIAQGKKTT